METVRLHDKAIIERTLRRNVDLHIYGIGDLDDFFRPYTTWYAIRSKKDIHEIALLYTGQSLPALLALSENPDNMILLIDSIIHLLPHRFYAHISPGIASVFPKTHYLNFKGEYLKMALICRSHVDAYKLLDTVKLNNNDLDELTAFYRQYYPENWFDPRMLETRQFYGIRKNNQLISVAGVHVFSKQYQVAALGNIATAPLHRNKGFGRHVTARVCQSLLEYNCRIGLNVKSDNIQAISCYKKLGFKVVASYNEYLIEKKKS